MTFDLKHPHSSSPILVSIPHSGTLIPDDIKGDYDPEMINFIDDTDFYVDKLYAFANELGMTTIRANYSRWVIDLNRNAENKSLYNDGRVITSLTPTSNFNGKKIYIKNEPTESEVKRRIEQYYHPYYQEITHQIARLREKHKHVLLFDCHSIRRNVPGIRPTPFPDLILGNADQTSADSKLIDSAFSDLSESAFSAQHNDPFKGGNITRHFGNPENGVHALQLEMSKVLYMDDTETNYDDKRADQVQVVLKKLFENLSSVLSEMNKS